MKVIKRYQNRKLYDTEASTYVTLEDIAAMVKNGEDVKVVDNKSKKDLTAITLAQIIFEEQKKHKDVLPLSALKRIIQSGGESIQDFIEKHIVPGLGSIQQTRDDVEKYVNSLISRGSLSSEEGRGLVKEFISSSQKSIDEIQKRFDERIKFVLERMRSYASLQKEVDDLEAKVAELEAKLASRPSKPTRAKKKSGKKRTAAKKSSSPN